MGLSFFLASASPRRLELLRAAGLDPEVIPAGLDEGSVPSGPAPEQVLRLAAAKARHAASIVSRSGRNGLVLAADTLVVLDGTALGKPRDPGEAASMLRLLSGRTHEVMTGVFLLRTDEGREASIIDATRVRFRPYGEEVVAWYVGTGEPMDKAGAYGIQGLGSRLVEGIEGSWSNVVGLPMERLPELWAEVGLEYPGR